MRGRWGDGAARSRQVGTGPDLLLSSGLPYFLLDLSVPPTPPTPRGGSGGRGWGGSAGVTCVLIVGAVAAAGGVLCGWLAVRPPTEIQHSSPLVVVVVRGNMRRLGARVEPLPSTVTTLVASRLFPGFDCAVIVKVTSWPNKRDTPRPRAAWCTNTSSLRSSGVINPNFFPGSYHFTLPANREPVCEHVVGSE